MVARDFKDLLQCAIPAFEALLPDPHNSQVAQLLFLLVHWHSLAKLRLHTDETLAVFKKVTICLSIELRTFANVTCTSFSTKELQHEAEACKRHQARNNASAREHRTSKRRFPQTNKRNFMPQLASIEQRQTHIRQIRTEIETQKKLDPVPDVPDQHHIIGKTQNFPVDIVPFVQRHSNDPAAADFVHKLKSHLLPHIQMMHGCSGRLDQDLDVSRFKCDCSLAHLDSNVIFKGDRFYKHMIMRLNFTSYDMRHETEVLNSRSSNRNIMMLVSEDTPSDHAYCYARVLGIFHANIIYTGPRSIDYLP
ncbi:hypothetical protein SCLCIDRAFT_1174655 [Scleroderma citrinum Foug A]|uniref:Uncharacterized protein n=1 Tax=Scleroderma citrinum Foug A TaxID=1036808 RepID=A0A0C3DRA6_9AGAM|nr:hypothetical protein SCLCIDRAFT_1174655 [Scleroderma citrinum Foug A]